MNDIVHYHVVVDYMGIEDISYYRTFTAAIDKARQELHVERLLDMGLVRRLRRKFSRRSYIPLVHAEWVGSSTQEEASPDIRIEVSACTPGMHGPYE